MFTIFLTIIILLSFLVIIIGYCLNFIKILQEFLQPLNAKIIFRIIGLFIPPIGGIMGYM